MSRLVARLLWIGALWLASCAVSYAQPVITCAAPNDVLERNMYVVGEVILDTPLSFTDKLASKLVPATLLAKLDAVRPRLQIQPSQLFHCSDYEATMDVLSGLYGPGSLHPGESFRLAMVTPELRPCRPPQSSPAGESREKVCADPPSVDVIYHIYTTDPVYYATQVFEARSIGITRALAPQGVIPITRAPQLLPYLGFNESRSMIFGSRVSMDTGMSALRSLEADVSGSPNSATASAFLAGSRTFRMGWVQYLSWNGGYRYENLPGADLTLESGRAVVSVLGASRAAGPLGTITRFGSSVERGHSEARGADLSGSGGATLIQSSAYGAVKSYAGLTFNRGRQAFAGSYGIQLGSASSSPSWDYTKHITNLSYSSRILSAEHKPLTIDLQGGAGYIVGADPVVPVAERFFGGNVERNFIEGDSWHLPRNPLMRGFAESEFGRTGTGGGIGGRNFYSLNLTISQTVKARPAVPSTLTNDPSFRRKLGGQVALARNSDKLSYLAETPEFETLVSKLTAVDPLLARAKARSAEIRTALPGLPSRDVVESSLDELDGAIDQAAAVIATARTNRMTGLAQIRTLAVGFNRASEQDDCNGRVPSLLTQLLCSSQMLNGQLMAGAMATQAANLLDAGQKLAALRDELAGGYMTLRTQADLSAADNEKVQGQLQAIDSVIADLSASALRLRPSTGPSIPALDLLLDDLQEARSGLKGGVEAISSTGDWLATGMGKLTPPLLSTIGDDVATVLKAKPSTGTTEVLAQLTAHAQRLSQLQDTLRQTMRSVSRPAVETRAIRDTDFTGRLLDVIFRELNLYSLAPFAMFDMARIGETQSPAFDRLRFAAGPGIRLSLVNFNVDLGYAFNANRQPGEQSGSFFFSISVSDLFR